MNTYYCDNCNNENNSIDVDIDVINIYINSFDTYKILCKKLLIK